MPSGIRRTKSTARISSPKLFGRKGYVATRTGPSRGVTRPGTQPYPNPPDSWPGTLPEWAIFWGHTSLGLREGVDFLYLAQAPTSGIQVDFQELTVPVGIQVQGEFWHYQFRNRPGYRDQFQRGQLGAEGIDVIWIDEDDALANPAYYVQEALQGRDHSFGLGQ